MRRESRPHVRGGDLGEIDLLAEYRRHLEGGDGPAFAGFFAPDRDRVAREVAAAGHPTERSGPLLSVRDGAVSGPENATRAGFVAP